MMPKDSHRLVKSMEFEVIVFDTAPTGHTLRFLSFPSVLEKALGKLSGLSGRFGPMMQSVSPSARHRCVTERAQMSSMMGMNSNTDDMFAKLESMRSVITEVNTQFKDPELTTFVCVCIAEFLSLYETERLVQELSTYEIDTHNIIINQLLFPPKSAFSCCSFTNEAMTLREDSACDHCKVRFNMQQKYVREAYDLYGEDFHLIKLPLGTEEIRGVDKLQKCAGSLQLLWTVADDSQIQRDATGACIPVSIS